MAKLKLVLNTSRKYENGNFPIFLRVSHLSQKSYISLKKSISKDFWDSKNGSIIINTKNKDEKRKLQLFQLLLEEKMTSYRSKLLELEIRNPNYTINDIIDLFKDNYSSSFVFVFFDSVINQLQKSGKIGNSKAYDNTYASFKKFLNNKDISFDNLDYRLIKKYDEYLQCNKVSVNTISYYMRTLRALYNRAIKEGVAKSELYPFKTYKIKREKTVKRAIVKSTIASIKNFDVTNRPDLEKARDFFMFSFYCRGMSFVDVAHLKVSNIIDGRINYARNKTNQKFTIKITPQIQEIIDKYSDLKNKESYIFPIIIDPQGDIYTQYRNAMRLTNKKLKKIGKEIGLEIPLTTYVSRHSWATIAKREGIPTAVISEGLGHESEKTTQIYLDSFENNVLDDANNIVTSF